jgi:integral membrane protein
MSLQLFRTVAFLEGLTTILLFLVAMPLKYAFDYPALVRPVGWVHGMAWLAYIAAMVLCLPGKRFGVLGWLRTFIAALFPFATFLNDPFVRRKQAERVLRSEAKVSALGA